MSLKVCVACLWHYEIIMKVISLWAKRIRQPFFYLSVTFLTPVVWASCVKTSKGIIFLPLQWYSRSRLLFFSWYLPSIILKVEAKYHFNWSYSFLYQIQDKHLTFDLSSPNFLLTKATIWTLHPLIKLITNHHWYHCSIVVNSFS